VPKSRISSCAIAVVFALTISASVTIGLDSWCTNFPGGTRRKIAATGSTRKTSARAAAPNVSAPNNARRRLTA